MEQYTVDHFDDGIAVLEREDCTTFEMDKSLLPQETKGGDILIFIDGVYIIDREKTMQRKEKIAELMQTLWLEE